MPNVRRLPWLLVPLAAGLAACPPPAPAPAPEAGAKVAEPPRKLPKNVILVIGDGMGPQQVGLLELYARRAPSDPLQGRPTAFARMADLGSVGLSMHYPMDTMVVDSACSATQLALGVPAPSESIGVDANGDPQPTVLERARDGGKATGLVSDTRLTHATPAAFGAHVAHRSMENDIAAQLVASGADVMLSGGRRHFLPQSAEGSKRKDDTDLLQVATGEGYTVVGTVDELQAAPADGKLLGLFASSGMMDAIADHRTRGAADRTEPSLEEMTLAALDRLAQDDDGFFLMVESGQVDWAGHANDAGWLLHEMVRANATVDAIVDWAEARDDTLVVVTADHETGGFGLSYSMHEVPERGTLPGAAYAGAGQPYWPNYNFGPLEVLDRLAQQESTIGTVLMGVQQAGDVTPEKVAQAVSSISAFPLTTAGAARVLATEDNAYRVEGHPTHDKPTKPRVEDFEAFYPYGEGERSDLVGRELATAQNVVWATGTHTHTPVPVFAIGPGHEHFGRLLHHTDIGQALHSFVSGSWPEE